MKLPLALLALSACGVPPAAQTRSPKPELGKGATAHPEEREELEEFHGLHHVGFEASLFYADGSCDGKGTPEKWLLSSSSEYDRKLGEIFPGVLGHTMVETWVDIRFRGRRFPKGHYGHMNRWAEQIELVELIEAKASVHCGDNPSILKMQWFFPKVEFSGTKVEIDSSYDDYLGRLVRELDESPTLHLKIQGHATKEPGSVELARQRASVVRSALETLGVPKGRLTVGVRVDEESSPNSVSFDPGNSPPPL